MSKQINFDPNTKFVRTTPPLAVRLGHWAAGATVALVLIAVVAIVLGGLSWLAVEVWKQVLSSI